MSSYLLTYDLTAPGRNYDDLIKHLKSYATHAHVLDSTWLIVSDRTSVQIRDEAKTHMDSNDQLLVVKLTGDAAWYGLRGHSDWIKKNL
ncbi:CRISPR-associated protein Cas2 [Microbacterium sp. AGC85]